MNQTDMTTPVTLAFWHEYPGETLEPIKSQETDIALSILIGFFIGMFAAILAKP